MAKKIKMFLKSFVNGKKIKMFLKSFVNGKKNFKK
jgi:hypothetical protein